MGRSLGQSARKEPRSDKTKKHVSHYFSDLRNRKNLFFDDPFFGELVESVENGIEKGHHPRLIPQGSSGSYFALNEDKVRKESISTVLTFFVLSLHLLFVPKSM